MIWSRKPKAQNALGLADASARMMEAIMTREGKGMAWLDFLAADAAAEAAKSENDNDEAQHAPERNLKMTTTETTKHLGGRIPHGGSREATNADRDNRRREYVTLRKRLGVSRQALARITGLSPSTLSLYPGWRLQYTAPTHATLDKMRREADRRDRRFEADAEMRAEIEREIEILEARLHVVNNARETEPATEGVDA